VASELGTVSNGRDSLEVRAQDGDTELLLSDSGRFLGAIMLEPAERDRLRELLDRAAMPGQPAAGPPAPAPEYGCCPHCADDVVPPPHREPCEDEECGPGRTRAAEATGA